MSKHRSWQPLGMALAAAGLFWAGVHCVAAEPEAIARQETSAGIRGAIYLPAEAYNAPQMWKNFNLAETRRDFGYAQKIHLNALRLWASYEYWQEEPERFQRSLDQLLGAAHDDGIRILISLFENDGVPPTPQNMWTKNPAKAFDIQSPGPAIASRRHQARWDKPRAFVKWFMKRYGDDGRLLAIEIMNEPGRKTVGFAKAMLKSAHALQGSVPLTMGTASPNSAVQYIPLGLNVIEFHHNFPITREEFKHAIEKAQAIGQAHDVPVWLTEWQRLRPGGSGWGNKSVPPDQRNPDYASLAPIVKKHGIANFFWSLMVKRAYLPAQRRKGTVNGLFWPDGTVWSVADARAIAGDPTLDLTQKQTLPSGFLDYLKTEEVQ